MDFDQHQPVLAFALAIDFFMHRLDQRALAHAARAPQQRIVGGQAFGEAPRVGQQGVALALDALEQRQIDMRHLGHRHQPALRRLPDKGVAPGQGRRRWEAAPAAPAPRRCGPAGRRLVQNAVFVGVCHANPLIFHGCKGGLARYSPPALPRPHSSESLPQYEYERSDVPDADSRAADDRDLLLSSLAAATASARSSCARWSTICAAATRW